MFKLPEIPQWQQFVTNAMAKEPGDRSLREENAIAMMASALATDIYAYFVEMFGIPPDDETLRKLPLDSACGDDCRTAIDAAKALYNALRRAKGDDADELDVIVEYVNDVLGSFWRG